MRRDRCLAAYVCAQPSFIGTVNRVAEDTGYSTGPHLILSVLASALDKMTGSTGSFAGDVAGQVALLDGVLWILDYVDYSI